MDGWMDLIYKIIIIVPVCTKKTPVALINGVRTIPVLAYWVLGSIHRYWVVLVLLGGYFLVLF